MKTKQRRLALLISSLLLGSACWGAPQAIAAPQETHPQLSGAQAALALRQDPQAFLTQNTLDTMELSEQERLTGLAYARLEPGRDGYRVRYVASDAPASARADAMQAYFLGFNGASNPAPAYVDIPAKVPEGTLLMTGTLSGCSVIVTERDGGGYRVFHDGRVGSSLLYDRVVMRVDYRDYASRDETHRYGAAFMIFKDGRWQLLVQKQQHVREGDGPNDTWYAKRGGEDGAPLVMTAGIAETSEEVAARLARFTREHDTARDALLALAHEMGISMTPQDLPFDPTHPMPRGNSPLHPALSQWNELNTMMSQAFYSGETGDLAPLNRQIDALRGQSQSPLNRQKLEALLATKQFLIERYKRVVDNWREHDGLWLWLERKRLLGTAAAINLDGQLAGGADARLYDRFVSAKSGLNNISGTRGDDYRRGLANPYDTPIAGLSDSADRLTMLIRFFDEHQPLTLEQKGALTARIEQQYKQEYFKKILDTTQKVKTSMEQAGGKIIQLMPQDLLLSGASGRCLPLSRAMSVALARAGERGVSALALELYAAAAAATVNPRDESAGRITWALSALHSNTEAIDAETRLGQHDIGQLVTKLTAASEPILMVIDTQAHSMLVGKVQIETGLPQTRYYFYDPNFGMMGFETPEALRAGLTEHFVKNGFGKFYEAYGEGAPSFNVRQISIDAMASVRLTGALKTVAELALPGSRAQAQEVERVAGAAVQMNDALAHDAMLKSSLSVFESLNLAESFHTAMQQLYTQEELLPGWLPVFDNITEQGNGRYRVPLMGPDGTLREVVTSDARIWTFKNHYQEMLTRIKGLYAYEGGRLLLRGTPETAEHVDGLNTAFAVQSMMGLLRKHGAERGGAIEPELDRALEIHTYVNLAQVAHGTVVDAAKVVQLYRAALTEAKPVVNASVSAIGHAANEGAAFLFGIANVGLDAFELSRAGNEVQKATFGTQLAFDSASLVATSAGLGAGLLGASTASAVLGGAGVIVAGLGIGFSALAQAFGVVAQDAQAVGRYFDQLDGAYRRGGYESQTLTADDGSSYTLMKPIDGAVIRKLDLAEHTLSFDSQYLYRTHHGSTGSGAINYFFWAGDMPTMVRDPALALNVREELDYPASTAFDAGALPLVLPATPRSYISYDYMNLPGATTRGDTGFSVLRSLENNRTFDYDFYIFPSEYLVNRITQHYEPTQIEVLLDRQDRMLLMRPLSGELQGKLSYVLRSQGAQYQVVLRPGAALSLNSSRKIRGTRWILDGRQLGDGSIVINDRNLTVGGVSVTLSNQDIGEVLVINRDNEVYRINQEAQSYELLDEDAGRWQDAAALRGHLDELAKGQHLGSHYVAVEHYRPDAAAEPVGKAFYETQTRRFIYTDRPQSRDFLAQAQLVAVRDDKAWLTGGDALWLVDVPTGQVLSQYQPFGEGRVTHSRLWQEGAHLYWEQTLESPAGDAVLRTYLVEEDKLSLVAINGDEALLTQIERAPNQPNVRDLAATELLGHLMLQPLSQDLAARRLVQAESAVVLTVSSRLADGAARRIWLKTDLPVRRGVINANLGQPLPSDLLLASLRPIDQKGNCAVYFYSHETKSLYFQPGVNALARPVSLPGLASVLPDGDQLYGLTERGTLHQMDTQGGAHLAAVNGNWIKANQADLRAELVREVSTSGSSLDGVALLGLTDLDGKVVNSWYDAALQRVIQVGNLLDGRRLGYLGVSSDEGYAWVVDQEAATLYRQPIVKGGDDPAISDMLVVSDTAQAPEAVLTLVDGVQSVLRVGDQIRIETGGLILMLPMSAAPGEQATLIGVTQAWVGQQGMALDSEFGRLGRDYRLAPAVRLGETSAAWYLTRESRRLEGIGMAGGNSFDYLGREAGGVTRYVYDRTKQKLFGLDPVGREAATPLGGFSWASISDGVLTLIATQPQGASLTPPRLAETSTVLMSAHGNRPTYVVGGAELDHYRRIVVEDQSVGALIKLPKSRVEDLMVQRLDGRLALYDRRHAGVLLLSHVGAAGDDGLRIKIEDHLIPLASLSAAVMPGRMVALGALLEK